MDKEIQYRNGEPVRSIKKKKKKKKKKNVLLKLIFRFIMLLIILIVIMTGILVGYVYSKLSKLDYQEKGLENVEINEGVENEGYLNIALFGIDARSNDYDSNSGSDAIMIVSINQKTKEVKMVSVYRDSYLCYDNNQYTKLTDIYRKYGPEKNS